MIENAKVSRRSALKAAAIAAAPAIFHIVPRHCLGGPGQTPPSEKLNIAAIGVGGQGRNDVRSLAGEKEVNIVALCDVDEKTAGPAFADYPDAKKYVDFRKMLEEQKDIDAVTVATPDHLHYVVSATAMQLGKHVYCQKPLTHSIAETRAIAALAKKTKVATQMGNQGNAREEVRLVEEWLNDGAIGAVREVHAWTNKPIWPTGIDRPKDTPPVPATLNWDLWLGPVAERPYHPDYLPFVWRGWWAFGSAAIGDMACHVINTPFRALKLGLPTSVEAYATKYTDETGPMASMIYYQFPARGSLPPVKLTWYEGGMMPPRPEELEPGRRMGNNEGVLFVGEKGKIMCGCYGDNARIIPETKMQDYKRPAKTIARSPGHYKEWIIAAKGGPQAGSHFEHAAVLVELVQLGNVAVRSSHRQSDNGYESKIEWDAANMKVTNYPEANRFLQTEYRKGWGSVG